MRPLVLLVLALAACTSSKGDDTNDTTTTGGGDDTDTNAGGDPHDGLSANPDCEAYTDPETGDQTPIPGATGYWVGDFAIAADGSVVGSEDWVLFANQAWKDSQDHGDDCAIVYDVAGKTDEPQSCASCDYSLSIDATLDKPSSDCVQGLVDEQATTYSVTYNVAVDGSGNATFYFTSGNTLGAGTATDTHASYATEGNCNWF